MLICSVQPTRSHTSETFIRAITTRLPEQVRVLRGPKALGGWFGRDLVAHAADLRNRCAGMDAMFCADDCYSRALRRLRPDVVLAQYGTLGAMVQEACRGLGIPLVTYFRGYDATKAHVIQQYLPSYLRLFQTAAAVVAVAPTIRDSLICLGCDEDKIEVNPSGADCEMFHGGRPESSREVFLCVGRFVPKKAPQLTLRAFAAAWKYRPSIRLQMIGDGPLLAPTRQLAESLGVDRVVRFLGARPQPSVARSMRAARAFLQHSVVAPDGDSEGTPVSVMEASACGLPVIATRHAGINDVVIHQETGLLGEEGDVVSMARHILMLAEQPALAGRLGRAGRSRATRIVLGGAQHSATA